MMNSGSHGIAGRIWTGIRSALLGLSLIGMALTAHAETFTVTNTNDAGAGSLREAIEKSNQMPSRDTIAFNIPGPGPHTITPLGPLPEITDPVTIDGYTQPGASPNTEANGNNAVLQIVLNGSGAGEAPGSNGLKITASGTTVKGLVINGFYGDGVFLGGAGGIVISGNFIGTDATGLEAKPNKFGILIPDGSSDNTIGGSDPQSRNVISGNESIGISINGANRTKIEGNFIGTDKTGRAKLGNSFGIFNLNSNSTRIGGTTAGQRNVISGNQSGIVSLNGSEQVIIGNFIGTDVIGTGDLGNKFDGVRLGKGNDGERYTVVGQTTAGAGNVIAYNGGAGVAVGGSSIGNSIRGNRIFKNGRLGIDLISSFDKADGVTENDPAPDEDNGPNRLQNFPELTFVEPTGEGIKVSGVLHSVPKTTFSIDFYGNEAPDPSRHGEGQFYLGTTNVTTDGGGEGFFEGTLPGSPGPFLSTTATRSGKNSDTSEFSPVVGIPGREFSVTNTNPTGTGSLAQAVQDSNATGNPLTVNRIIFNIPGEGSHVINVANVLTITQPVVIDGYSQLGAIPNTSLTGFNGVIKIGLDGDSLETPVLDLLGNGITVMGLAILKDQPTDPFGAFQLSGNGNWISGNLIGITPGSTIIANRVGITSFGEDNLIGGSNPEDRNVISGNLSLGVGLGDGAKRNTVQGNLIGTDLTGTLDRGNSDTGVLVADGDKIIIGDNVIAFNVNRGVFLSGASGDITISRNSMFENGGIGIDLPPPGVNPNVPNGDHNYPVLASATITGSITIAGTLNSTPNTELRLEFFASPACSPSGFGEGKTFLAQTLVTTDDTGNAPFSATLPDTVSAGQVITSTATAPFGNTSEFSRCITAASGPPPAGTVVSSLSPEAATSAVGTSHTVTATITTGSAPLAGATVNFNIVSGPNSGQSGSAITDSSGQASFTYTSDGAPGTDTIEATGTAAGVQFSCSATEVWTGEPLTDLTVSVTTTHGDCVSTAKTRDCPVSGTITLDNREVPYIAADLSLTSSCKLPPKTGCKMSGTLTPTIADPGSLPVHQVGIYLSEDSVFDTSDVRIGTVSTDAITKALAKGKVVKLKIKLPTGLASLTGSYLLFRVDDTGVVAEGNENNNESASDPLP